MANIGDKGHVSQLTDISRNKRQASVLLNEIARERTEMATRKCAQSAKLVSDCKKACAKAKELRSRHTG